MINEDLKIEIRPIPERVPNNRLMIDHSGYRIGAMFDPASRKYVTGLSEEDLKYLKEKGCPYDLSADYKEDIDNLFWGVESKMKLEYCYPATLFPGKNILHFIQWKYILVNPFVYNSRKEMEKGDQRHATHFICDEEEEHAIRNAINSAYLKKKGACIIKFAELPLQGKRDIIHTILKNIDTDNRDADFLTECLDQILFNKDSSGKLEKLLNISVKDKDSNRSNL